MATGSFFLLICSLFGLPAVDHDLVAVGIFDEGHVADRRLVRLHEELYAARTELADSAIEVVSLQSRGRSSLARSKLWRSLADDEGILPYSVLNEGHTLPLPDGTSLEAEHSFIESAGLGHIDDGI